MCFERKINCASEGSLLSTVVQRVSGHQGVACSEIADSFAKWLLEPSPARPTQRDGPQENPLKAGEEKPTPPLLSFAQTGAKSAVRSQLHKAPKALVRSVLSTIGPLLNEKWKWLDSDDCWCEAGVGQS